MTRKMPAKCQKRESKYMLIRNTTREILDYALRTANEFFNGNILFRDIYLKSHTRKGAEVWKVNLTVKSKPWRGKPDDSTRQIADKGYHYNGERHDTKDCGRIWSRCPQRYDNAGVVRKESAWRSGSKYIAAACWHAHGQFF